MNAKKAARAILMTAGAWVVAYAVVSFSPTAGFAWWGLMVLGVLAFYVAMEV